MKKLVFIIGGALGVLAAFLLALLLKRRKEAEYNGGL